MKALSYRTECYFEPKKNLYIYKEINKTMCNKRTTYIDKDGNNSRNKNLISTNQKLQIDKNKQTAALEVENDRQIKWLGGYFANLNIKDGRWHSVQKAINKQKLYRIQIN